MPQAISDVCKHLSDSDQDHKPFSNRPGGSGGAGGELQSARGKDHKDIRKDNSLPPSFPMYQSLNKFCLKSYVRMDGYPNSSFNPFPLSFKAGKYDITALLG